MIRYGPHSETSVPCLSPSSRILLHVFLMEQQRLVVNQPSQHKPLVLRTSLDSILKREHHRVGGKLLRIISQSSDHLALWPPYRRHKLALQRLLHGDALVWVYDSHSNIISTEGKHTCQQLQRRTIRMRVHFAEVCGWKVIQREEVLR